MHVVVYCFCVYRVYNLGVAKVQVGIRFEPGLVAAVDAVRGGLSRTAWIERAVEQALGDGPVGGALDAQPVRERSYQPSSVPASVRLSVQERIERATSAAPVVPAAKWIRQHRTGCSCPVCGG